MCSSDLPRALGVVASILAVFIFVPGFPALPFLLAAVAMGAGASLVAQREAAAQTEEAAPAPAAEDTPPRE